MTLRRCADAWQRFWFQQAACGQLGLLRLALVTVLTWRYLHPIAAELGADAARPVALLAPSMATSLLPLPYPPPAGMAPWLAGALLPCALVAALGVATRWSLALFTILAIYLLGGQSSWGTFNHDSMLTVQVLVILTVAPGSTAWSFDACWRHWRGRDPATRGDSTLLRSLAGDAAPRWGLQLILVTLALLYCACGIAKLRHGGLGWLDGRTLATYLGLTAPPGEQLFTADPTTPVWRDGLGLDHHLYRCHRTALGGWLAQQPVLLALMASATVLLELAGPVLLRGGWWRNAYLVSVIAMHTVIGVLMGHPFTHFRLVCLLMLDWEAIGRAWSRFRTGRVLGRPDAPG